METTVVAAQLRVVIARTARRLRQESGTDLSPSQTSALAAIDRHGPLTPSELARHERIQRPTATRVLAHLEGAGLITRTSDPADGRSSVVSSTAEGVALLQRTRTRKDAFLVRRLEALDAAEIAVLERATDILERVLAD
jgi:DNA-binding MarR family transcriptional regulator